MESSTVAFSCHRERRRGANWGLWRIFLPSWRTMVSITPVHGGVTFSCTPGNPPRCRFRAIRGAVVERTEGRGGFGVPLWNEPKACNPCGRLTFVSAISLAKSFRFGTNLGKSDGLTTKIFGSVRFSSRFGISNIWFENHLVTESRFCSNSSMLTHNRTVPKIFVIVADESVEIAPNQKKSTAVEESGCRCGSNRGPWRIRGAGVERIEDRGGLGLR